MKSKILELINNSKSILIVAHEKPDGDAVGSVIALYHVLNEIGKDVTAVMPEIPRVFSYLNGIDGVVGESNKHFDLGIIVDSSSKERVSVKGDEIANCKTTVVIDHHASNTKFGDVNYVDVDAPACSQVLFYLFKEWGLTINKDAAEALTTGLITDTNGFSTDNVNKDSFIMAGEMLDLGVDVHNIYQLAFTKKNMAQHLLMKIVLDRLEFYADGKIAFAYLSKEDMDNVGAAEGDHEGLVNLGRNIDGVEVSVFIREDDGYRISLRSNGLVDVNKVAIKFGGGGHRMAAGIKFTGNFKETKDNLISEIIKELNQ